MRIEERTYERLRSISMLYKWQNYLNFPSLMWLGGEGKYNIYTEKHQIVNLSLDEFLQTKHIFQISPQIKTQNITGIPEPLCSFLPCLPWVTHSNWNIFPSADQSPGPWSIKTRTHGHLICKTEGWIWRTCAFWFFFFLFFLIFWNSRVLSWLKSLIFREAGSLPWMPTEPEDVLSFALSGWGCNQVSFFPVYLGHSTDEHWPDQECSSLCAVINTEEDSKEQRRNLHIYIKLCYRIRHIIQSPHHL